MRDAMQVNGQAIDLARIAMQQKQQQAAIGKFTAETSQMIFAQLVAGYIASRDPTLSEGLDATAIRNMAQAAKITAPFLSEAYGMAKVEIQEEPVT